MDFTPIRRVWRDVQYDSQLEADWAASLIAWGVEYVYHPGRLFLKNGDIYEPDFQLTGDMMLEVKGNHDSRLEKSLRASSESGIPIVVGRSSFLPAGSDVETAGAVWEDDGWALNLLHPDGPQFVREMCMGLEGMHYTAHLAYARQIEGIRMFKAVGESDIK